VGDVCSHGAGVGPTQNFFTAFFACDSTRWRYEMQHVFAVEKETRSTTVPRSFANQRQLSE
ncbi:MAG: hypothetical protein SPJ13_08505, partial [Bacteroidales bacterium]|nr:hypothetical protein [Bacteroidales bacterium]